MSNIVVYTVIMGNYDTLRPIRWPGICLSDCELKPVREWKVKKIRRVHSDLRRASRYPKMMPHVYFPKVEYTIYIDGNIQLLCNPNDMVTELLQDRDIAMFAHPQRKSVYHEARKCIVRKKGDPKVIKEQMQRYRRKGFPANFGLTACWVIIRRNTPEVRRFGEVWWGEYLRHSCRDQLSFDYVRWKLEMKYNEIPGNLFKDTSLCFKRGVHD